MKTLLFSFLILNTITVFAQTHTSAEELIGKRIPDFYFNNVINYHRDEIDSKHFTGRYLILDFWSTYCAPCIKSMSKITEYQDKFKDSLQFMLVAIDKESRVKNLYEQRSKLNDPIKLPTAIDTNFAISMGIQTVPHYIWVDPTGIVKAVTGYNEVNEKNIRNFLQGKDLHFTIKEFKTSSNEVPYTSQIPFLINGNGGVDLSNLHYYSILTGYKPGLESIGTIPNKESTKIVEINAPALNLFLTAYGNEQGNFPFHRVEFAMDENSIRKYKYDKRIELEDWANQYAVCYDLRVPKERADDLLEIMRNDLKRFFPQVSIDVTKRKERVLVFKKILNSPILIENPGGKQDFSASSTHISMKNQKFSRFVKLVWFYNQSRTFLDETGIDLNVNLDINANMFDFTALNEALEKYGLSLKEEERYTDFMIIKEHSF